MGWLLLMLVCPACMKGRIEGVAKQHVGGNPHRAAAPVAAGALLACQHYALYPVRGRLLLCRDLLGCMGQAREGCLGSSRGRLATLLWGQAGGGSPTGRRSALLLLQHSGARE